MGLNLCVYRIRDSKFIEEVPHSVWDSTRYAGDKEFAAEVLSNPIASFEMRIGDDYYFRPRFVSAWRDWDAAQASNVGRWARLTELLRTDHELWVYQSW